MYIHIYVYGDYIHTYIYIYGASMLAQLVKNSPAKQEPSVRFVCQEAPLEKGDATHSSILRLLWWLRW